MAETIYSLGRLIEKLGTVVSVFMLMILLTAGCLGGVPKASETPHDAPVPDRFEVIDADIPLTYYGEVDGVFIGYQPATHNIALKAREAFYDYSKTGNASSLKKGLHLVDYLIRNATYRKNSTVMVWEYPFPWPSYNMSSGWIGALSQAGILKALLLAYQATGDERYLEYSKKNLNAFSISLSEGGLRAERRDKGEVYYWYPEYARENPPYVLNGFITALLWIKEYHDATGGTLAKEIYEDGLKALIHFLPSYDKEGWSYYDALGHVSNEHYHKMHVEQLQSLYRATGNPLFLQYHERWSKGRADRPNAARVWIEIHDVGANYDLKDLKKIVEVIDKHQNAYDRVVLFVIPNYGGSNLFHEDAEFSEYLKTLESRGYLLGQHGYTHEGNEFAVGRTKAEEIIKRGMDEFRLNGFERPRIFLAPRWNYTDESMEVAQGYFDEVYMDNGIYFNKTFVRHLVHEYTNDSLSMDYRATLVYAKADYEESREVFRLSMHLAFAASEDHLGFLDAFFAWVEARN